MRAPSLIFPVALALAAPLAVLAQENPKVLFCSGECFIVDAKGVRTPAPKGTEIPPGFRLVTSAGGYAQVKLSPSTAMGLGEGASVVLQRTHVVLDQGRIRLVGGEAFGKPISQPIELRTNDGTFTLRNADVEMKTTLGKAAPTLVKLNAGDVLLGSTALTREGVQTISTGKVIEAPPVSLTELAIPTKVATLDRSTGPTTLSFQPTSLPRLDTFSSRTGTFTKLETFTKVDTFNAQLARPAPITSPEKFLAGTATTSTGETITVSKALQEVTAINKLQQVTVVAPTTTVSPDKTATQIYDAGTKIYTIPTTTTKSLCFTRGC
jgi:hypothetical protein